MKCKWCGEEVGKYNFFVVELYDDKGNQEEFYFCSEKCAKEFQYSLGEKVNRSVRAEISLCPGYYDCKELGNLRNMCSRRELRTDKKRSIFESQVPSPVLVNWCEPAQVASIRANLKLLKLIEKTDEISSQINQETLEHTREMRALTKKIFLLTLFNVGLVFVQIVLLILS